jgi:Mlc titration factor MtfA (ptsG expression regulator)
MSWLGRWWRARILDRHAIPPDAFDATLARLPILRGLDASEQMRLREAASLFIHDKTFSAAGGANVDDATQRVIALQACLLTLNLGEDSYRGWSEIILYPDEFLRDLEEIDEAGVVHRSRDILAGESWHGGPLVLSLADVATSGQADGVNVVLHEFAHKLDMLNGDANGFPPLHRGMSREAWSQAFGSAYADFCRRVDADEEAVAIDPYAAASPGEFFAVMSEAFFEIPHAVSGLYPEVYGQLRLFYRQDPAARATM